MYFGLYKKKRVKKKGKDAQSEDPLSTKGLKGEEKGLARFGLSSADPFSVPLVRKVKVVKKRGKKGHRVELLGRPGNILTHSPLSFHHPNKKKKKEREKKRKHSLTRAVRPSKKGLPLPPAETEKGRKKPTRPADGFLTRSEESKKRGEGKKRAGTERFTGRELAIELIFSLCARSRIEPGRWKGGEKKTRYGLSFPEEVLATSSF